MPSDGSASELDLLQSLASDVRGLVNEPRLHHALWSDRGRFDLACSAMDIIDDIIFALSSYIRHDHDDQGLAYLEIFGVLQSLCVQQDAVRALFISIVGEKIDLGEEYAGIKVVREMRVRVAGHPVGGLGSTHFLVRYTVSKWGFELWKYDKAGSRTADDVSLLDLIAKNTNGLCSAMRELIRRIEAEKRCHKEIFVGKLLSDIFKQSHYFREKMHQGITRERAMGIVGTSNIRNVLRDFRNALDERDGRFASADFVTDDIPLLIYALDKFDSYMRGDEAYDDNEAKICAAFIDHELVRLQQIAKEIDDDYRL